MLLTPTIEGRYSELKSAWQELQDKHEEYVMLLSAEELDEEWIEELNETFGEHQVKTDRYLDKVDRDKAHKTELKVREEMEEAERKALKSPKKKGRLSIVDM